MRIPHIHPIFTHQVIVMKKFYIALCPILSSVLLLAQPTIDQSNFIQAGDVFFYDTYTNLALEEVGVITQSGADFTWDFSALGLDQELNIADTYVPLDSTPEFFEIFFGNPFLAGNNLSNLALTIDFFDLGLELPVPLTVENSFQFYRSDEEGFFITGSASEVEGLPLISTYENLDRIYSFPLNYLDADENAFDFLTVVPSIGAVGQEGIRSYFADGWGELILPGSEVYNCLRVRTELDITDTIYIDFTSFGSLIERPLQVNYTWISPEVGGTVAEATFIDDALTSLRMLSSASALSAIDPDSFDFSIYPNPVGGTLNVSIPDNFSGLVQVMDITGRIMHVVNARRSTQLDVSGYPEGIYLISVKSEAVSFAKRIVVQH